MIDIITSEHTVSPVYKSLGVTEAYKTQAEGKDVIVAQISADVLPLFDMVRAEECAAGWWKVSYFNTAEGRKVEELIQGNQLKSVIPTALGQGLTQVVVVH